jgi:hypothetical protein
MAQLTQSQLQAKIDAIDVQLAALYGTPGNLTDYKIGSVSVSRSGLVESLVKAREMYQKELELIPNEVFQVTAVGFKDTGEDDSEFLGD